MMLAALLFCVLDSPSRLLVQNPCDTGALVCRRVGSNGISTSSPLPWPKDRLLLTGACNEKGCFAVFAVGESGDIVLCPDESGCRSVARSRGEVIRRAAASGSGVVLALEGGRLHSEPWRAGAKGMNGVLVGSEIDSVVIAGSEVWGVAEGETDREPLLVFSCRLSESGGIEGLKVTALPRNLRPVRIVSAILGGALLFDESSREFVFWRRSGQTLRVPFGEKSFESVASSSGTTVASRGSEGRLFTLAADGSYGTSDVPVDGRLIACEESGKSSVLTLWREEGDCTTPSLFQVRLDRHR